MYPVRLQQNKILKIHEAFFSNSGINIQNRHNMLFRTVCYDANLNGPLIITIVMVVLLVPVLVVVLLPLGVVVLVVRPIVVLLVIVVAVGTFENEASSITTMYKVLE